MHTKNILVIGCGSIGERHFRCLLRMGRARVTACDANTACAQRIAKDYRVDCFTDLSAALASQLSTV